MKKKVISTLLILLLVLSFSASAFAARSLGPVKAGIQRPTVTISNDIATCKSRLYFPGETIIATLELTQGGTVVNSWSGTGNGYLLLSGTTNVIPKVTYTLTVYGTIDGVAFTPASINFTP